MTATANTDDTTPSSATGGPAADAAFEDDGHWNGWTGYSTCTGYLILAVEAEPDVANIIAEGEGIDLSSSCEQCGDGNYHEHDIDDAVIAGLDDSVTVTAAQVPDALIAAERATARR